MLKYPYSPCPPSSSTLLASQEIDRTVSRSSINFSSHLFGLLKVSWIVGSVSILFRYVSEIFVFDHSFRHIVRELLNLLSDVSQEGVALPSSNHHDGEN